MISSNRPKDPNFLMPVGMMCLVIAVMLPWCLHPATQFGRDLSEGVRGMLFGLSLSLNVGSAIMIRRQRRCAGS